MSSMNIHTGAFIDGDAELRQAIADVLFTPIGSCVAMRDYGSFIPSLLDQPANPTTAMRLYAATALALSRWLSRRIRLRRVQLIAGEQANHASLAIEFSRRDAPATNSRQRITIPLPTYR